MNNPKISVIVPIYNVEPYLRECLDSIVNQTLRELEIICVNDGSTDGSAAILDEYAAKDNRVQIVTKENGGLNTARNAGLDRVTGEYFVIVDSDDWLDLTAFEKMYARAKESGADLTKCSYKKMGFPDDEECALITIPEASDQSEKIRLNMLNITVWVYLWKTDFVKRNQLRFHDGLLSCTEIPFTHKAALLANKIAFLPERLYFYRYRSTSMTGDTKSNRFLDRPRAFTLLFEDLSNCNLTDESRALLYKSKWEILYFTYNEVIAKAFRPELKRRIIQSVNDEERQFITSHADKFDLDLYYFFLKCSGSFKLRCKYFKYRFVDGVVKRLIPHSPWLQRLCQIIDRQNEEL